MAFSKGRQQVSFKDEVTAWCTLDRLLENTPVTNEQAWVEHHRIMIHDDHQDFVHRHLKEVYGFCFNPERYAERVKKNQG